MTTAQAEVEYRNEPLEAFNDWWGEFGDDMRIPRADAMVIYLSGYAEAVNQTSKSVREIGERRGLNQSPVCPSLVAGVVRANQLEGK